MKQKILDKLKANRTSESKDVTDTTLEAQAGLLANFITNDEALAKLDAVDAIKSMQGNINFTASSAVKAEREKLNQKTPEQIAAEKAEADRIAAEQNKSGVLTSEAIAKLIADGIAAGVKPIQDELVLFKQGKSLEQMQSDAKKLFKGKYSFNNEEEALSNEVFNIVLELNKNPESAEKLVEAVEAKYNAIRTASGSAGLQPIDLNKSSGGDGKLPPRAEAFKAKMQAEGKLPKADK